MLCAKWKKESGSTLSRSSCPRRMLNGFPSGRPGLALTFRINMQCWKDWIHGDIQQLQQAENPIFLAGQIDKEALSNLCVETQDLAF